ncbi:MAG: hypothetical protein L0211_23480 [Planctomycetaceae bacterium]|nr:hypothetical protein [Planctomycetaceae bacterium]
MDSPSPFLVVPPTRDRRWRLIEEVIAQWYPVGAGQAIPSGTSPPAPPDTSCAALHEWYAFVRRQPGVWCRQDSLFCSHFYKKDKDYFIIGVENQACAFWGVRREDLSLDDPPVYLDEAANGQWVLENTTTSEFAVTWLASSIKWSDGNRRWANGPASEAALPVVTSNYPRLGLADWHWPLWPTRFYGTADLVLEVHGEANDLWFWLVTRTDEAFRRFQSLLGAEVLWEASSDEWPDGWVNATSDSS